MAGEGSGPSGGDGWAAREQHAEELVDRFTHRVVETVARTAARAREEAEDLLAEARQRRRSGPPEG